MKKMFRKAFTVLGSVALVGATVGMAAATSYPEPFTSNTAVIVGANADSSDNIAAASIAADLDANTASSGTITITGGESYQFEKSSTKFNIGDSLRDVVSTSIDDDDLPELLAEGTFVDDDNDEFDFTQEIDVANITLALWEDNDYKSDEPTVGFKINSGANVLNYTLDFTDEALWSDLETSTLTLMGKEYYVLDTASNTTLTLLDSASDALLTEGETATLNVDGMTYTVTIDFVSDTEAKLTVNGETTNSISEGQTYKLSDGAYLGLKDILYSAKDTGVSKVEFSIGNGKLVLQNATDVELNEDSIDGLSTTITNSGSGATTTLSKVELIWDADDELFITEDSEITMPGFEAITLTYTGVEFPAEEEIAIENNGDTNIVLANFPLQDSTEDIYILEWDTAEDAFNLVGKDSDEMLLSSNSTNVTFDGDLHEWAVVSWNDGDDTESYLIRATSFKTEDDINKTTFQYRKDGNWVDVKSDAEPTDDFTLGNIEITVGAIDKNAKTVNYWATSSNTAFDVLYSEEGMKVYLPWSAYGADTTGTAQTINLTAANYSSDATACAAIGSTGNRQIGTTVYYNYSSAGGEVTGTCAEATVRIDFEEEDKDDNTAAGGDINVTVGVSGTADTVDVQSYAVSAGYSTSGNGIEEDDSDVYYNYVYSELATEVMFDKSGDQETLMLVYHGSEVMADVYLTSPEATSTSSDAGVKTYTDNQMSSFSGMNLVVVGGSAINSVAADLLGGAYSESAFTSATGVSAGEFLIQSFDYDGEVALLVAGYNAEDTTKATTYLLNEDVDTTVGTKLIGTSATEATVVTA